MIRLTADLVSARRLPTAINTGAVSGGALLSVDTTSHFLIHPTLASQLDTSAKPASRSLPCLIGFPCPLAAIVPFLAALQAALSIRTHSLTPCAPFISVPVHTQT